MRLPSRFLLIILLVLFATASAPSRAQSPRKAQGSLVVPRPWVDTAVASQQLPLAVPAPQPELVPAEYYHRIPVRPIYKSFPVYAPGAEPKGYFPEVRSSKPQVLWDGAERRPRLETTADWIEAGRLVFETPFQTDV